MANFFAQNLHQVASNGRRFSPVGVASAPRAFGGFRAAQQKFIATKFGIKPSTVYANTKDSGAVFKWVGVLFSGGAFGQWFLLQ